MKIKDLKVWKEDFALSRPYTIAFRTITHVSNLFVELSTDTGLVGVGTGSPEHFVTGETFEACESAANKYANTLIGKDIEEPLLEDIYAHLKTTPAACAAFDMAVWDLLAKNQKQPLCELLGKKINELPTSITIGIKPIEEVVVEANEYLERGFQIIKLKLGKDFEEDIERTVRLRETVGNNIAIRVDLNQGYSVEQTVNYFEKTKNLGVEFVEQPLDKNRFDQILQLPPEIRQKVAADESLQSPEDAERFVDPQPWCGIFNIKLMKCGGITASKKIASVAEAHQVSLMWGCMDESRVSISAALHAAFSSSATRFIDLDGHLDLERDLVSEDFILQNGIMKLGTKPGLGCERL